MKISIVIPLYVPTHLLTKISEFLVPQIEAFDKYTQGYDLEVIYVPNGCDERVFDVLQYLKEKHSNLNIKIHWRNEALGYTVATNIGISNSLGDFILLFNDDCILLPQPVNLWINASLEPFKNEKVGIVTIHEQYCPYAEDWFGVGYYLLLRKKMLDQIGILDQSFGLGLCEDIDICLRAKQNGWERVCIDKNEGPPGDGFVVGWMPLYHKAEVSFNNLFALGDMGAGVNEKAFVRNRGIIKQRRLDGYYSSVTP